MVEIPNGYEIASKRRLALAGYLDFLVFGVPWAFLVWALSNSIPALGDLPFFVKVVAFLALEAILLRQVRWSPGSWLLSIRVLVPSALSDESQETFGGRVFVVRSAIRSVESWWTLLLGVLCVLNGAKSLVRWAMFVPPLALFGVRVPEEAVPAVMIAMGLVEWALAVGVLRLRASICLIGVVYYAASSVALYLSWHLFPAMVEEYTILRRAYQGLPVREGEIEMMQSIAPVLFVGVPILMALWILLVGIRARKRSADQESIT